MNLVLMENQDHQDLKEQRVKLDWQEGVDLLEYQESRGAKVKEENKEPQDLKDSRDNQEHRVLLACQENKERLENLEKVEKMARLVPGESEVLKVNVEPQE